MVLVVWWLESHSTVNTNTVPKLSCLNSVRKVYFGRKVKTVTFKGITVVESYIMPKRDKQRNVEDKWGTVTCSAEWENPQKDKAQIHQINMQISHRSIDGKFHA